MNTLALRVVLLTTLLFGINIWTGRHLGAGIGDFALVNSFLAFVALVLSWIDASDAESFRARFRRIQKSLVNAPVLAALYVLTLVGTSLVSSVTVLADGSAGITTLHLTAEGATRCEDCKPKSLHGPSGIVRYVRMTTIFGRPYYLEASGYQRKSFQLYPWTGATISLARDLEPLPTVVLRVPTSLHGSLAGGKVVLDFGSTVGRFEIPTEAGRASVQFGPPAAIPESWRSEWRSELRTLSGVPDTLRESFYRNWLNPVRNEAVASMVPGTRVQIQFLTAAGNEVVQQDVVIGRESLQDIALTAKD